MNALLAIEVKRFVLDFDLFCNLFCQPHQAMR